MLTSFYVHIVKEEFEANEIFTPEMNMSRIFDQTVSSYLLNDILQFPPFLRALTEGVNVSVFMFGATGSGKTHSMEGSKTDPGLVQLIADNLFNIMEDKRFRAGQGGSF